MSRTVLPFLLSLSLLTVAGCASEPAAEGETIEVEIGPVRTLCVVEAVYGCLNQRAVGETKWSLLYQSISGFTFEWGWITRVRMTRVAPEPGVADDPGSYVLRAVLSRTAVPAGTRQLLSAPSFYAGENPWSILMQGNCTAGYRLYGEKAVRFPTDELCRSFASKYGAASAAAAPASGAVPAIEIEFGAPDAPATVVSVRD